MERKERDSNTGGEKEKHKRKEKVEKRYVPSAGPMESISPFLLLSISTTAEL
jgi:hypothetical protein